MAFPENSTKSWADMVDEEEAAAAAAPPAWRARPQPPARSPADQPPGGRGQQPGQKAYVPPRARFPARS
jgi:hypothetical protein